MDEETQILQMNQIIDAGIPVDVEHYKHIRDTRIQNLRKFYEKKLEILDKLSDGATTIGGINCDHP